ncbi:unnamed protein product [Blepharisma stoltei]|uniref:IQCH-like ATP-grasp domain-containing protein n=1 Tax=Blepharisma stoltei TaxID=1481888 RepID=A0AAU9IU64_9CILI|nr:unnamed protein product [Blepharisma stoltei]
MSDVNDMGKMLLGIQERLSGLKDTLKTLDTTYIPQITAISSQMEKVQTNLKQQSEQLLFKVINGDTTQDVSGQKHPKRSSLSAAGELHMKPPKYSYVSKASLNRKSSGQKSFKKSYDEDVPCITENDITKGMFNLINRGVIPKDVDLTPAFTRGAAPFVSKTMTVYPGNLKPQQVFVKSEEMMPPQNFRFDFTVSAIPKTTNMNIKQLKTSNYEIQFEKQNTSLTSKISETDPNPRGYNELMDTFSSHFFIIRKGVTLDTTPEFISYQRTYVKIWEKIAPIIRTIESFLANFQVPKAILDGKKIVDLIGRRIIEEDIMDCFVNKEEVRIYIKIPRIQFQGESGKEKAAVVIQSMWRMHKARTAYLQLQFLMKKASCIQRAFRRFMEVKNTRRKTAMVFKDKLAVWKQLQQKFKEEWPVISQKKRLEIHISSLSIDEARRVTMQKFLVRQNLQISRIFKVQDPNIDILYISAFEMTPEIVSYYMKILELGNIADPISRLNLVSPDLGKHIPTHISTTKAVLFSPKTIARLKHLVKRRTAYIVPGNVSKDEIELAVMLGVPILGGDPNKAALFSTKSGSKRILTSAEVPVPPGAYDIYDEKEFMATLTRLIANNLNIDVWLFKIDNEFSGRGHASLDIMQCKYIKNLRKSSDELNEEQQEKIYHYLTKALSKKVKIAVPSLYSNWREYMKEFVRVGGVIEATPLCLPANVGSACVCFCIEPDGNVVLSGAYDKLEARRYVTAGYMFPQNSLPNMNFKMLADSIGKVLYEKDIFGYVSVDLVSFPDPSGNSPHPLFWAVDLDCQLSVSGSVMPFFDFLMEGSLDMVSGHYHIDHSIDQKTTERCFMYLPVIEHPGISKVLYKTFFYMCRVQGISFDLELKKGTTFILPDCIQSSVIGLLTMGGSPLDCSKLLLNSLKFVETQAGDLPLLKDESRDDAISFSEILSMVKLINKKLTPKPKRK